MSGGFFLCLFGVGAGVILRAHLTMLADLATRAREMRREAELAPFLVEAQREVDAML